MSRNLYNQDLIFLIFQHLNYQISDSNLKPGSTSDHSLINLVVDLFDAQKRGTGYSKFNNSLLLDKTYVHLITVELNMFAIYKYIQDINAAFGSLH